MIIQYAVGSFGSPCMCAGPIFAFWNILLSFSFLDFSVASLALSIGTHSNFLLLTVMIMFLGFGILITAVALPVDIEGLRAASLFRTSGSASSLTMLSFTISGNGSGHLYTSAGASLPFYIASGFIGYIPDSSNPLMAYSTFADFRHTSLKTWMKTYLSYSDPGFSFNQCLTLL